MQQFDDRVGVDVHLPRLGEEGVDAGGEDFQPLAAGQRRGVGRDVGASRAAFLDDSSLLQFAVGAGNGIWIEFKSRAAKTRIGGNSSPALKRAEATRYFTWLTICK